MENIHVFYVTIIVILTGLFAHAHYWLARADRTIKELTEALLRAGHQIEFANGLIAGQHERILTLQDEVERLRDSTNIIDLPTGLRSRPRQP